MRHGARLVAIARMGWSQMSPLISVFNNFMPDHLNYYQADGQDEATALEQYFADKANIFKYQDDSGVFVTVPAVFEQAQKLSQTTLGQEVVLVDGSALPEDTLLAMPGEHNRQCRVGV